MHSSTAKDRWDYIEFLAKLGWTSQMIAKALKLPTKRVEQDVRNRGGMKRCFPSRPHSSRAYQATFSCYAKGTTIPELLQDTIMEFLEIDRLQFAAAFMSQTMSDLYRPAFSVGMRRYEKLLMMILKPYFRHDQDFFASYIHYLKYWPARNPKSAEQALEGLRAHVWDAFDRGDICMSHTQEACDIIDELLDDRDLLTDEEQSILARTCGIGHVAQSDRAIARHLGVSSDHVRKLRFSAIGKIVRSPYSTRLHRSIGLVRAIERDRRQLENRVDELQRDLEELRLERTELVRVIRDGNQPDAKILAQLRAKEDEEYQLETLRKSVDELLLSHRSLKSMKRVGIEQIGQLVQVPSSILAKDRRVGLKATRELEDILMHMGIPLGTVLPERIAIEFPLPKPYAQSVQCHRQADSDGE